MCGDIKSTTLRVEAMKSVGAECMCSHCGASNASMEEVCFRCGRTIGVADDGRMPYRGDLVRGSFFARGPHDPLALKIARVKRVVGDFMTQEDVLLICAGVFVAEVVAAALIMFLF